MAATIEGYERAAWARYEAELLAAETLEERVQNAAGAAAAKYADALKGDGTYQSTGFGGKEITLSITDVVGEWLADREDWMLDLLRGNVTVQQVLDAVAESEGKDDVEIEDGLIERDRCLHDERIVERFA